MPTTRTILLMLLNRYSEPPGSPEHTGTIVEGGCSAEESYSASQWPERLRFTNQFLLK